MPKTLVYFGTVLPQGVDGDPGKIPSEQFTKRQMARLSFAGKPHHDDHGLGGRAEPMGQILHSRIGADGEMYVLGEITDQTLIAEIVAGRKRGLSISNIVTQHALPDRESKFQTKRMLEISSVDEPLIAGRRILDFEVFESPAKKNPDDNLSGPNIYPPTRPICEPDQTPQHSRTPPEMSATPAAPPATAAPADPPAAAAAVPDDVKVPQKTLIATLQEYRSAAEQFQTENEALEEKVRQLSANLEMEQSQTKTLRESETKRSDEQNRKLIQMIQSLAKMQSEESAAGGEVPGADSGAAPMLTEEDLPKPGEAWGVEQSSKFTDTVGAVMAYGLKSANRNKKNKTTMDELMAAAGTPLKRKRMGVPPTSSPAAGAAPPAALTANERIKNAGAAFQQMVAAGIDRM